MASRSFKSLNVDSGNQAAESVRNCGTIAELHAVLPLSFRPALAAYLTKVYRIATKSGTVGNTIAQYERHVTNKTFPPFIEKTIKVPTIQFSNEYDGTKEGKAAAGTLKKIVHEVRIKYLKQALELKKEEQTTLLGQLVFDEDAWHAEVETTATRVAASLGAIYTIDEESPSTDWMWSGASVPDSLKLEAQGLWLDGNIYHAKAIGIARAVADKTLLQRVKNLSVKEKASVDKMDVDSKDQSVKSAIEEALKDFKKELISGAITVKQKTTAQPKGGRKKGGSPKGGRNQGRVNKTPPKKRQMNKRKN